MSSPSLSTTEWTKSIKGMMFAYIYLDYLLFPGAAATFIYFLFVCLLGWVGGGWTAPGCAQDLLLALNSFHSWHCSRKHVRCLGLNQAGCVQGKCLNHWALSLAPGIAFLILQHPFKALNSSVSMPGNKEHEGF